MTSLDDMRRELRRKYKKLRLNDSNPAGLEDEIEKYYDLIYKLHKKARDEGREYGFLFCEKDEKLFPSMTTSGGEHAIAKLVDCEMFEGKTKGMFHTHPSDWGMSEPSTTDMCSALELNCQFLCVSGQHPYRMVGCWTFKSGVKDLKKSCMKLEKAKTIHEAREADAEIRKKTEKYLKPIYLRGLP